jgi:hypothetical protein
MSNADAVRLEVLNPAGEIQKADKKTLAPRPASLKGKKLGLIYNLKSGGDVLLTRTAELLKERYDIGEVKWFKRACCVEPPEGYIESAAEWSDVAVAAASD